MTNTIFNTEFVWRVLLFVCVCAMIFASSDAAFASGSDVIGQNLCLVVKALGGNIAKSIGTVAIMGVAGGLLMGKLNWTAALTTSVGVIIIFSASSLVGWIAGSSGGAACS